MKINIASSMKIAIIFLLFGGAWILLTDKLLLFLVGGDLVMYNKMQTFKGLTFVMLAGILIYMVSSSLNKSLDKANQRLKNANKDLSVLLEEQLKHQQEISKAIIKAQETERKQLGEELHDNIHQILATTKLYLEHAIANPDMQQELIKKSSGNIMDVIAELRKLSKTLTPPRLSQSGLINSIHELMDNIMQGKKIQMELWDKDFSEAELHHDKKLIVYRIIQEQLNNVLRHSDAQKVIIELKNLGKVLGLRIIDDGKGFETKAWYKGIGLSNIRSRAEMFNGTMNIISAPGKGCTLQVEFEV